jgi:YD repeat-containing protein
VGSMTRAFRPSMGRRLVTICGPIVVFGLGALCVLLGLIPRTGRDIGLHLDDPVRSVMAGLVLAIGLFLALRNALVGIVYRPDRITVVNAYRTVRIPAGQVSQYLWTPEGLLVEWRDQAGHMRRAPVNAFHSGSNPMADLGHGQEVHRELEALRMTGFAER